MSARTRTCPASTRRSRSRRRTDGANPACPGRTWPKDGSAARLVQWLVQSLLFSAPAGFERGGEPMGEWPDHFDMPDQVFVRDNPDASEIAARDEFNRNNPPLTGFAVPDDLRTIELVKRPWRNNRGLWFELAENRIPSAHLAELAPGGNSVRHRPNTEAYLYIVKGEGYSIINYEGQPEERVDWSVGTLFSPPVWAWHQHFNTSETEPA